MTNSANKYNKLGKLLKKRTGEPRSKLLKIRVIFRISWGATKFLGVIAPKLEVLKMEKSNYEIQILLFPESRDYRNSQ